MRTKRRNTASAVAAVAMLALVLGSEPAAHAANGATPGAPPEGIKVRGDWTIEIRDPDGSLVSRHAFENALVPGGGDTTLARLLGRTLPGFLWRVSIGDFSGPGSPCLPGAATPPDGFPCVATEPDVTVTATPEGTLRLSGSVTARRAASIALVVTELRDPNTQVLLLRFTQKQLSSPIPVTEGQIIGFTVVFSFS